MAKSGANLIFFLNNSDGIGCSCKQQLLVLTNLFCIEAEELGNQSLPVLSPMTRKACQGWTKTKSYPVSSKDITSHLACQMEIVCTDFQKRDLKAANVLHLDNVMAGEIAKMI